MSVCGTGTAPLPRGFSRRCGVARVGLARGRGLPIPPHPWARGICLARRATGLDAYGHQGARASPPGPPVGDDGAPWYGTVNPLSIAYARSGLGLGPTDPERIDLAQEPLGFRCGRFSRPIRYSCRHSHFRPLHPPSRVGLRRRAERSPTARPPSRGRGPLASALRLAPLRCRRRTTRPVSCYALFQGWLLLSQPPGCLGRPTAFPTRAQTWGP